MAITLTPTAKQTVRFTDAVIAQLSGQTHQAAEQARASAETAIQADMTGTA